jgi:predicted aldo/keto reductase-like oxidoreductase
MPCPQGIDIPSILNLYNEYYMVENRIEVKEKYLEQNKPESRADQCVSCAECEEKCPQQLPIRKFMSESNRMYKRRD